MFARSIQQISFLAIRETVPTCDFQFKPPLTVVNSDFEVNYDISRVKTGTLGCLVYLTGTMI